MSVKSDTWIVEMSEKHSMITPFERNQISRNVISFGISSYGYDVRISDEYRVFTENSDNIVDPKNISDNSFKSVKSDFCIIPPNSFILGRSVEYFKIPREIIAICFGKSTYARCGVVVNITPLEPEWEGYITIHIANTSPCPVKIYSNEGIGQILFLQSDRQCKTSYADKKGKYQSQNDITTARIG